MLLPENLLIEEDDTTPTARPRTRSGRRSRRTLGMAAALLVTVAATSAVPAAWAAGKFSDVPDSHPLAKDINWMADQGISTGYDDGTFRPSDEVTRGAMSAFLHRLSNRDEVIVEPKNHSTLASDFTQEIACPAGKRAIAGGGMSDGSKVQEAGSRPWTVNGKDGWKVIFHSDQKTGAYTTAWVLCTPAK